MYIRYISIDCATKSLAISIVEYNNKCINLENINTLGNLKIIKTLTKDLIPGKLNKDINEIERVSVLCKYINDELIPYIDNCDLPILVLIEKQISTTPTYIIYITLMTIFVQKNIKVDIISATRKNQLVIGDEKIGKYLKQCSNSYLANKLHSKNMVELIKPYLSDNHKIEYDKKMVNDWSDTISQLIAYILHNQT